MVQAVAHTVAQVVGLAAVQVVVQTVDTEEPAVARLGYSKLQMTTKGMGFHLLEVWPPKQTSVSSSASRPSPSE